MSDDFEPLSAALADLMSAIEPASRKKLGGAIAGDIRNANARRIRANKTPEGAAMEPRKSRAGDDPGRRRSAKAKRMFQRAAGGGNLRRESTPDEASVFFGSAAARIMAVHHFGLRDRVTREPGAPEVSYPERPLLGLTDAERAQILDRVAAQLEA